MAEFTGVIQAKSDKTGGVKIADVWYTCADPVKPYLAKMGKGDSVVAEYKTEKYKKIIVKLTKDGNAAPAAQESAKAEVGAAPAGGSASSGSGSGTRDYYGSPADVKGKQVGCALGAAASLLAGRQEDPETLAEMCIVVAKKLYEYAKNA